MEKKESSKKAIRKRNREVKKNRNKKFKRRPKFPIFVVLQSEKKELIEKNQSIFKNHLRNLSLRYA